MLDIQAKKDGFDNVLKYKACWVTHSYKKKKCLHYANSFIVIVKPISYKYLMAMEVRGKFSILYMDIVMALFYDFYDQVVYIE